jgi:hypothetical protein
MRFKIRMESGFYPIGRFEEREPLGMLTRDDSAKTISLEQESRR